MSPRAPSVCLKLIFANAKRVSSVPPQSGGGSLSARAQPGPPGPSSYLVSRGPIPGSLISHSTSEKWILFPSSRRGEESGGATRSLMEASVRRNLSGTFTRLLHLQREQKKKKS